MYPPVAKVIAKITNRLTFLAHPVSTPVCTWIALLCTSPTSYVVIVMRTVK